jgi:hypothetical protein
MKDIEITINRQKSATDWTLSSFISDDLKIKGVGVEDEFRTIKVHGETRIKANRYQLGLTPSPKFSKEYYRDDEGNLIIAKDWFYGSPEIKAKYHTQHEAITVLNVENFDRILWHWGNDDLDTDGCYIVGSVFGKSKNKRDGVVNSRKKYTEIYPIIFRAIKAGKVYANYVDHE